MTKQEVVAKQHDDMVATTEQELIAQEMAADASGGFEEADKDSFAIPFLKLLQDLSPECDKKQGTAIEGAVSGMFFNSATQELFAGSPGVLLLPVHFSRRFLRWKPREEGGGFMGSYSPLEVQAMNLQQDEKGHLTMEDGSFLSDTREHYCLVAKHGVEHPAEASPVVVSLGSTQIKKSKRWMSAMQARRIAGPRGPFCPPTYSLWWTATTMVERNDQGAWYGWALSPAMPLTSKLLLDVAKSFREAILSGDAKAAEPVEGEVPF